MERSLMPAAVAAIAAILVGGGCGKSPPESVSAEQLVERGDAICATEQRRFSETQAQPAASAGDAAEQTEELADAAGEELEGLEGMSPPAGLSSPYDAYLESLRAARELIEEGKDAADEQDSGAYGKLQAELAEGGREREKLARAVGFKNCSKLGGAGIPEP